MSYFQRPFGSPDKPEPTLAQQLSSEWESLEQRLRGLAPEQGQTLVGDFLRRWGVALTEAPSSQQTGLSSLLDSARASLLGGLASATQKAQAAQWQAAETRQRRAIEQAEHERKMEAGRAEVRRLQAETAGIQGETWRASQIAIERNHQLARAALFPEQHCPYCARAYLDLTGGCWHCQHLHRPGHF